MVFGRRTESWQERGARPPRPCSTIRLALLISLVSIIAASLVAASAAAVTIVVVKPSQELAVLFRPHTAFSLPSRHSAAVYYVRMRLPITV